MKTLTSFFLCLFCFGLLSPALVLGWYPRLVAESLLKEPSSEQIVGKDRSYILAPGEVLPDIARRCRLGYNTLVAANPGIDPWLPGDWQKILLPYRTILPDGAEPGITINLAEYRLYLIWEEEGKRRVRIYPIGIGQEGWNTPEGTFEITVMIDDPSWTIPEDLREGEGPFTVETGTSNPLGQYWLGLSAPSFGIHGTNEPFGVGRRVSHGCIRLYPDDIEDLNQRARVGMPVNIVYQPIKLALDKGRLLAQINADFLGRISVPYDEVLRMKNRLGWEGEIDRKALEKALSEARGIPVPISKPR